MSPMPAVFVHGVPETAALWDGLILHLERSDVVALSLPGFGAPRSVGFGCTKEDYVGWLIDRLEEFGEPVDLVGHDWGGGLALRVASLRSGLLRSWVSDALYVANPTYRWHEFARIWQTPGKGEAWMRRHLSTPVKTRAEVMARYRIPITEARRLESWFDAEMGDAILRLYRSAKEVGPAWADDLERVEAPGLALWPSEDPFADPELVRAAARRAGAVVKVLDGLGHWWMLEDPARSARALEQFWAQQGVD